MSGYLSQISGQPGRPVGVFAVAAAALAASLATAAMLRDERFVFLATGLWALALMLVPYARAERPGLFSVWSFVGLTVGIGVTARGVCLTLGYPEAGRLDELYFRGREAAFFFEPALALLTGLGMLVLGHEWRVRRPDPVDLAPVCPDRLRLVCVAVLVVSAAATWLYVSRTGGWQGGDWSGKRTPIPGLEVAGTGYQSHGGLRFAASLAGFGHVLAVAGWFAAPAGRRIGWAVLAAALLLVAVSVPFHASLRTPLVLLLVLPAAMVHLAGRRIRPAALAATVVVALLAIQVMTVLRNSGNDRDAAIDPPTPAALFDAAVLNRNQIELPKTAHLYHAVPRELPLAWGATVARWVLAPIPRSLWPDKPVIQPGPIVGQTLYDQPIAGVPPSLVGELFWNFHWPGVIIGAFLIGLALRMMQAVFQPIRGGDPMRAALFVAGPMTMGFEMVGGSIGSGLFRGCLQTAVMLGLLWLARNRSRVRHSPVPT